MRVCRHACKWAYKWNINFSLANMFSFSERWLKSKYFVHINKVSDCHHKHVCSADKGVQGPLGSLQHLQREAGERRYVTGQVVNFGAAVTAEQISTVQTHSTEIFTLHLLNTGSRFRLLTGAVLHLL